ncbi:MAG: cytochrome C oxidase subunit IV family protein [Verrucomicrobiota bacterium]
MSQHSASPAASHGGDDHVHDIAAHVRTYLIIFGALLVGTVLTVAMYYVDFSSMALTVAVALFIATIKAFLVAGYFMHLLSEKKLVYGVLILSAIFFTSLMGLTLWGTGDLPKNSDTKTLYVP